MPQEIRFGVIGGGLMGREFASAAARWCHLLDLDFQPVIVAVADLNPKALDWFRKSIPSVKTAVADYRDLLNEKSVDAVYAAVPHNLHEQVYIDVLRAGKHLMAEKPFGIDQPACIKILAEAAKSARLLVRCSSEFPFFPGAQAIFRLHQQGFFGPIIEVRAGLLHSSDLDPNKPINWKRQVATNGRYGCMGDLGLHVLHLPLRMGFQPTDVRALLSNLVPQRPDPSTGRLVACDTFDNALLSCHSQQLPMTLETKRIAPGETDTWYLEIDGMSGSARFSTKNPKTLWTMPYQTGGKQAWQAEDLGYDSVFPAITGKVFEFGFPDAVQQMWAAFCEELATGQSRFPCATPEEAAFTHALFTAALASHDSNAVVEVAR